MYSHAVLDKKNAEINWIEITIFLAIGLIGLIINEAVMCLLTEQIHFCCLISKASSVAIMFFWNFLGRKIALFGEGWDA
jgi:putative flippase GtrA